MPANRREFLQTGVTTGAALVIGFSLPGKLWAAQETQTPKPPISPFEAWVHVGDDDRVKLIVKAAVFDAIHRADRKTEEIQPPSGHFAAIWPLCRVASREYSGAMTGRSRRQILAARRNDHSARQATRQ